MLFKSLLGGRVNPKFGAYECLTCEDISALSSSVWTYQDLPMYLVLFFLQGDRRRVRVRGNEVGIGMHWAWGCCHALPSISANPYTALNSKTTFRTGSTQHKIHQNTVRQWILEFYTVARLREAWKRTRLVSALHLVSTDPQTTSLMTGVLGMGSTLRQRHLQRQGITRLCDSARLWPKRSQV